MQKSNFWLVAIITLLGLVGCQPATSINFAERRSQIKQVMPAALPVQAIADEEAAKLDIVPLSMSLQSQSGRVMVLSYHDVVPEGSKTVESDVTVEMFRDQMNKLYTTGCNVITVDELYRHLAFGAKVPPRAVCITFDDNYQGVKDYAIPILKSYSYPSAVYVHTDFVGNTKVGRPKMSWDTLRDLIATYDVTVGSHTASHPDDIRLLTPAEIRRELIKSKEVLESKLNVRVDYLAWPHGRSDSFSVQIARQAGYKMAFGTEIGEAEASASMMQVNRFPYGRFNKCLELLVDANQTGMVMAEKMLDSPYEAEKIELLGSNETVTIKFGGTPQDALNQISAKISEQAVKAAAELQVASANILVSNVSVGFTAGSAIKTSTKKTLVKRVPIYDQVRCPIMVARDSFALMMPRMHHTFSKEYEFRNSVPPGSGIFRGEHWLIRSGMIVRRRTDDTASVPRSQFLVGWREDGSLMVAETNQLVSIDELSALAAQYGCTEAMSFGPSILKCAFEN